jgi:SAM-dependent methyltransferase
MPSLEQNLKTWNETYTWAEGGDEWSRPWGGPAAQWYGAILPRIRAFVPTHTILEIAPGFGRWTQFLIPLGDDLILVDMSAKCIAACRRRFVAHPHVRYHVNDGRSLDMVEDHSINFAFTFDSLVHVEVDVLHAYFEQLSTKLAPDGVAFVHHSNLGAYVDPKSKQLPETMKTNPHWRALSVSADALRIACADLRLCCVSQEMINFGGKEMIDAITVVAKPGSRWAVGTQTLANADFNTELGIAARLARLYDSGRFVRGRQTDSTT